MGKEREKGQSDGRAWNWTGVGAGCALVFCVCVAYLPAFSAGFIWDDDEHIVENKLMHESLWRLWTEHEYYYPLTSAVWWILRRIWGLNPFPFHALNIVLHGLNAVLLWRLLRGLGMRAAWMAAAVWAVHPVNVQSVAWATELKNCLSGALYLGALLAWLRSESAERRWAWYGGALAFAGAALISKTSTVTLPAAIVLIEVLRNRRPSMARMMLVVPFGVLSLAAGLWTLGGHEEIVASAEWDQSLGERMLLATRSVGFYAAKIAWPFALSFVYPRWEVGEVLVSVAAGIGMGAVAGMAIWRWTKGDRASLVALAYFVASLFPVLNFFRMYYARYSFVADHWQYLASMGAVAWLVGAAGWVAARSGRAGGSKLPTVLLASGVLLGLGGLTLEQSRNYLDLETVWRHVLRHDPNSWIGNNNLAETVAQRGDYQGAFGLLRTALESKPPDEVRKMSEANLANVNGRLGRQEEALRQYLKLQEEFGGMEVAIAKTLAILGRVDESGEWFERAMKSKTRIEGLLPYSTYLIQKKRHEEAIELCREYVQSQPSDVAGYMFLANAFESNGMRAEAIEAAERGRDMAERQQRDGDAELIRKRLWELRGGEME